MNHISILHKAVEADAKNSIGYVVQIKAINTISV